MPSYQCPGVYVEEVSSGSKPISSVATAIAGIVGNTYGGTAEEPIFISSFKDYENAFGPVTESSDVVGNYVQAFYNNGGGSAYVVSANVVKKASGLLKNGEKDLLKVDATDFGKESAAATVIFYTDTPEGEIAARAMVKVGENAAEPLDETTGITGFITSLNQILAGDNLTATLLVNDLDDLISFLPDNATDTTSHVTVSGGADALSDTIAPGDAVSPKTKAFNDCLGLLENLDIVTMLMLPEVTLSSSTLTSNPIYAAAIAQCEKLMDRMVFIDPPSGTELGADSAIPINSSYAVLYYPWVKVSTAVSVAPSAFAAGMWSKIDQRRGVWKAPAGLETGLTGVNSFEFDVNNAQQSNLNPKGINVLRKAGGTPVVWGARTLASASNPEWRYIPVRRTFIMVEESLQEGIQWAVFEPNSQNLWQALKLNISSYLNGLWRAGAFQGGTADQAYFVRCGLGVTMTQAEIDEGKVIIEVGFAPLKPAEFVIIKIQQKVSQL
jgi:hypothetical protein